MTVLEVGALDTTRDFIDVRDVATALLLLAQSGIIRGCTGLRESNDDRLAAAR